LELRIVDCSDLIGAISRWRNQTPTDY